MLALRHRALAGFLFSALSASLVACSGKVEATDDGGTEAGPDAPGSTDGPVSHPGDGGATHDAGSVDAPVLDSPVDTGTAPPCQSPSCGVPPSPTDAGGGAPSVHEYAIRRIYLGDTDRTGVASASAWKFYGYDLDGLVTSQSSTNVCTLEPGAAKSTQVDGAGGIDNSFGENILPIMLTTGGTNIDQKINASIEVGHATDLFYVTGFDGTPGATTSALDLGASVLLGADYATLKGAAPAWDLSTHWPVDPASLQGCTGGTCPAGTDPAQAAYVQITNAYQTGGLFVGQSTGQVALGLSFGGGSMPLTIRNPIITFLPAAGGVSTGTVAGVIDTADFVNALQQTAGAISTSLCSGSAFASIAQQITQANDIVLTQSGTIANVQGAACNAISVGIGFDATEIAPATSADIAPPSPPAPDPCADQ